MHAVVHDANYGVMHGSKNALRTGGPGGNSTLLVKVLTYAAYDQTQTRQQQQVSQQPTTKKIYQTPRQ